VREVVEIDEFAIFPLPYIFVSFRNNVGINCTLIVAFEFDHTHRPSCSQRGRRGCGLEGLPLHVGSWRAVSLR